MCDDPEQTMSQKGAWILGMDVPGKKSKATGKMSQDHDAQPAEEKTKQPADDTP